MDDMPDDYWVVKTNQSVFYVSESAAHRIRQDFYEQKASLVFLDLAGSSCFIPSLQLIDMFSSTPAIRNWERTFREERDQESESPPWE